MALIIQRTTERTLTTAEWDLKAEADHVPDYQLLAMLHYEYARCYKPLIDAVEGIRGSNKSNQTNLEFAKYLARHFPEFPKKRWVQIPSQQRQRRLNLSDINKEFEFYVKNPAWEAWGLFDTE